MVTLVMFCLWHKQLLGHSCVTQNIRSVVYQTICQNCTSTNTCITHKNHNNKSLLTTATTNFVGSNYFWRYGAAEHISHLLLVKSEVPSKYTSKDVESSNIPIKLYLCTSCTDNENPWMIRNEEELYHNRTTP